MIYHGQTMKALTVRQPWASFIAIRAKLNETRGWKTEYRGPLAVHAGIAPVTLDVLRLPGIEAALRRHCVVPDDARIEQFPEFLPLGKILCLANLVGCTKTDVLVEAGEIMLTEEFRLGNYEPGRYALRLEVFHSFDEGIPATGKQGFWSFTFPSTPKLETEMTKKNKNKPDTLDEGQVLDEKGAIDSAFSQERPGAPTDPVFDEEDEGEDKPAEDTKPVPMPEVSTFTHAIDPSEFLPPFQKIVFVKLSREDLAIRAEQMAACDVETAQLEVDMANEVKEWKDKIKAVEAKRMTLSAQVTAKGEEREIECRKRINEDTQEAVIFDANTLQVIETYKLTDKELQTELRMADTYRAAADTQKKKPKGEKVVKGNFPADKVVGATAVENAEQDRKNDEAVKALAGKKS